MKRLHRCFIIFISSLSASHGGIWYGAAGDNQWSNANNWVLGDIADGTSENAVFDTRGAGDIVLTQARNVRHMYQASGAAGTDHTFSGSAVSVYGNLSNNSTNDSTMTFNNEVVITGGIDTIGTKQGGRLVLAGGLTLSDHTVLASANSGLEISGNIDAGGKDLRVTKVTGSWDVTPTSVLSLTGSGIWISGGVLKVYEGIFLAARDAANNTGIRAGSVQLFDGGTLRLGNDEQVVDSAYVSVGEAGGLFDLDGHMETIAGLGALSSGLTGAVAMGDGGILHLSNQGSANLGGLNITEWTQGEDHIYVDGGAFTSNQLANIAFAEWEPVGAKVEDGELLPNGTMLTAYDTWALDYGVVGGKTADDDDDGLSNLYEYGLGGDPTNSANQGISPAFGMQSVEGTNSFEYIYPQRVAGGLSYQLELSTDLVSDAWANAGYLVCGTNVTGGPFDYVTNTIPTMDNQTFIRLVVE